MLTYRRPGDGKRQSYVLASCEQIYRNLQFICPKDYRKDLRESSYGLLTSDEDCMNT